MFSLWTWSMSLWQGVRGLGIGRRLGREKILAMCYEIYKLFITEYVNIILKYLN
jgi:hypothetical protein